MFSTRWSRSFSSEWKHCLSPSSSPFRTSFWTKKENHHHAWFSLAWGFFHLSYLCLYQASLFTPPPSPDPRSHNDWPALLCLQAEGEKAEGNGAPPSDLAAPASGPEPTLTGTPAAHTNGLSDGAPCDAQGPTEPPALDLHIPETSTCLCDVLIHFHSLVWFSLFKWNWLGSVLLACAHLWSLFTLPGSRDIKGLVLCFFHVSKVNCFFKVTALCLTVCVCDVSILMLSAVHLITHHLFLLLILQASNSATPCLLCLSLPLPPAARPPSLFLEPLCCRLSLPRSTPTPTRTVAMWRVHHQDNHLPHHPHPQLQPPSPGSGFS